MTSIADLQERGRSARKVLPRSAQAEFSPLDRDPVAIIETRNADRIQRLVPIGLGRMLQSPFAFYRGTAALMANDLAGHPTSGIEVVACGDAHISNFGFFATPERNQTFELNDFDEASNGPWEWDVKRLAASVVLGSTDAGLGPDAATAAAQRAVESYRTTLASLMTLTALERKVHQGGQAWLENTTDRDASKVVESTMRKARRQTSDRLLRRIVTDDRASAPRIVDQPPIMVHSDAIDLASMQPILDQYLRSVRGDIALLLSQFQLADVVLRVVGVGSVGTRCYIALLLGQAGEPLFLQVKEAMPSVLETHGGIHASLRDLAPTQRAFEGYRVVTAQRILQSASDPFLGYMEFDGRDYYIRQFRDMKGSFDLTALTPNQYVAYGRLCGALLARGHAQSPFAAAIVGYLGTKDVFDQAIATWATSYADQVRRDFAAFEEAVARGRLTVERDV